MMPFGLTNDPVMLQRFMNYDNNILSEKAYIKSFLFPLISSFANAVRIQQLKSVEQVKQLTISNATMAASKNLRP